MLRTGQLRRAPPRPRDLARRRGPRYRGPWRLPGPDSHRLAAVSLALGYPLVPPFITPAPELLDAHSCGTRQTKGVLISPRGGCSPPSGCSTAPAATIRPAPPPPFLPTRPRHLMPQTPGLSRG